MRLLAFFFISILFHIIMFFGFFYTVSLPTVASYSNKNIEKSIISLKKVLLEQSQTDEKSRDSLDVIAENLVLQDTKSIPESPKAIDKKISDNQAKKGSVTNTSYQSISSRTKTVSQVQKQPSKQLKSSNEKPIKKIKQTKLVAKKNSQLQFSSKLNTKQNKNEMEAINNYSKNLNSLNKESYQKDLLKNQELAAEFDKQVKLHLLSKKAQLKYQRNRNAIVSIEFRINRKGEVLFAKISKSSKNRDIDRIALKLLEKSAPFPTVPEYFAWLSRDYQIDLKFYR